MASLAPLPPIPDDLLANAHALLNQVIACVRETESGPYLRSVFVQLHYDYCVDRDQFVRFVFVNMSPPHSTERDFTIDISQNSLIFEQSVFAISCMLNPPWLYRLSQDTLVAFQASRVEVCRLFTNFADNLLFGFYYHLKGTGRRSSVSRLRSVTTPTIDRFTGFSSRSAIHQADCMARDGHRCLVSGKFDVNKIEGRTSPGGTLWDFDGLAVEDGHIATLQAAHIIPHSVIAVDRSGDLLSERRKTVLTIFGMFDPRSLPLIDGTTIDNPENILTLSLEAHVNFDDYRVYFEEVENAPPNSYRVMAFNRQIILMHRLTGETTTLIARSPTVALPSPILLKIHAAIANVLYMSAAGLVLDRFYRDMEAPRIPADGSIDIGRMVSIRINDGLEDVDVADRTRGSAPQASSTITY